MRTTSNFGGHAFKGLSVEGLEALGGGLSACATSLGSGVSASRSSTPSPVADDGENSQLQFPASQLAAKPPLTHSLALVPAAVSVSAAAASIAIFNMMASLI
jgi:hypothetical protein